MVCRSAGSSGGITSRAPPPVESAGPASCQEVSFRSSGDCDFTSGSYQASCPQCWLFERCCGSCHIGHRVSQQLSIRESGLHSSIGAVDRMSLHADSLVVLVFAKGAEAIGACCKELLHCP